MCFIIISAFTGLLPIIYRFVPDNLPTLDFCTLNAGYKPADFFRHKFPLRSNLRQDFVPHHLPIYARGK